MEQRTEGTPQQTPAGLRDYLLDCGACCVGFADLSEFPKAMDQGFTHGVSIGLALRPEPIVHLRRDGQRPADAERPVHAALQELAQIALDYLSRVGCTGRVLDDNAPYDEGLNDDALAVRSGIAWIGKSSRPVNWEFGSALRFISVLTDAELPVDGPAPESFCGTCRVCTEACAAHAPSGTKWQQGMTVAEFFNSEACLQRRETLLRQGLDCRYCMSVCPFTLVYLSNCGIDLLLDE